MIDKAISPLRKRMIEDMTVRHFKEKVQKDYIRHVKNFTAFLGHSPDTATSEDLRLFQLHMTRSQVSPASVNCAIVALRFFFKVTLQRADLVQRLTFVREPRKAPIVLSQEEVARLLEAAPSVKYKAALGVAYGAGLRVSEVVALKVSDIDSQRMLLRVEQGKGHQDRYVMLSPRLLELLRDWWRIARPRAWLFPGQNPVNPMTARQLNRACHAAAQMAEITKRVSPHTLRHSFATHLLEQNIDIRVIQVLFGHAMRESTQSWKELLVDLKARGLSIAPKIAVGDGALGFWRALDEAFPSTRHQRCWVHKTLNALDKLPKSVRPNAHQYLREIWLSPDRAKADFAITIFAEKYAPKYDKAVDCLLRDRETLLTFFDFPAEHWTHLRKSNPIESAFATVRHRTIRMKGALSQDTARLMVFKLVMAASKSWRRLQGQNQLPKVVSGVTFRDGIEVAFEAKSAA